MKPDRCEGCRYNKEKDMESGECYVPMTCAYCTRFYTAKSDKFKPAEPKVLSAEESLFADRGGLYGREGEFGSDDMVCAFEMGEQNGQNREWQRPEQVELREAVKRLFYPGCNLRITIEQSKALEKVFKNLKPPNELRL